MLRRRPVPDPTLAPCFSLTPHLLLGFALDTSSHLLRDMVSCPLLASGMTPNGAEQKRGAFGGSRASLTVSRLPPVAAGGDLCWGVANAQAAVAGGLFYSPCFTASCAGSCHLPPASEGARNPGSEFTLGDDGGYPRRRVEAVPS